MTEHGRKHTDGSRSGGQPVVATRKAHTAVLEVLAEWGIEPSSATAPQLTIATTEALSRAIEQHEFDKAAHQATIDGILQSHQAFRQEVSNAVVLWRDSGEEDNFEVNGLAEQDLLSFIIPAKPDPLVELVKDLYLSDEYADRIRAALDALGLEIREKGQ